MRVWQGNRGMVFEQVRELIRGAISDRGPLRTRDIVAIMDESLGSRIQDVAGVLAHKYVSDVIVAMRRRGELFCIKKGPGGIIYYGNKKDMSPEMPRTADERFNIAFEMIAELRGRIEHLEAAAKERI